MLERYKKLLELSFHTNKHSMYSKLANEENVRAGKHVMNKRLFAKHTEKALDYWAKCATIQLKIDELQKWFQEKYGIRN